MTALAFNSTKVLDHMIIADKGYYSYWKSGKLATYEDAVKSLFTEKSVSQKFPKYEVDDD